MKTAVEVMTALASHDSQVVAEGARVRLLFSASHDPPEAPAMKNVIPVVPEITKAKTMIPVAAVIAKRVTA
jgi:hypothetical protein